MEALCDGDFYVQNHLGLDCRTRMLLSNCCWSQDLTRLIAAAITNSAARSNTRLLSRLWNICPNHSHIDTNQCQHARWNCWWVQSEQSNTVLFPFPSFNHPNFLIIVISSFLPSQFVSKLIICSFPHFSCYSFSSLVCFICFSFFFHLLCLIFILSCTYCSYHLHGCLSLYEMQSTGKDYTQNYSFLWWNGNAEVME